MLQKYDELLRMTKSFQNQVLEISTIEKESKNFYLSQLENNINLLKTVLNENNVVGDYETNPSYKVLLNHIENTTTNKLFFEENILNLMKMSLYQIVSDITKITGDFKHEKSFVEKGFSYEKEEYDIAFGILDEFFVSIINNEIDKIQNELVKENASQENMTDSLFIVKQKTRYIFSYYKLYKTKIDKPLISVTIELLKMSCELIENQDYPQNLMSLELSELTKEKESDLSYFSDAVRCHLKDSKKVAPVLYRKLSEKEEGSVSNTISKDLLKAVSDSSKLGILNIYRHHNEQLRKNGKYSQKLLTAMRTA